MNEEQLNIEREELRAKLDELERIRAAADEPLKPRNITLDAEDKLRLENLLLREKLAERERKDARDAFHAIMVAKYKVNLSIETIQVDASTNILSVLPKSESD